MLNEEAVNIKTIFLGKEPVKNIDHSIIILCA